MSNTCKRGDGSFFIKTKGDRIGLYCSNCGKRYKWLTEGEARAMKRQKRLQDNDLYKHDVELMERLKDRISKVRKIALPNRSNPGYIKLVLMNDVENIIDGILAEEKLDKERNSK